MLAPCQSPHKRLLTELAGASPADFNTIGRGSVARCGTISNRWVRVVSQSPNFAIPSVSNGLNLCRNVRQIPQICWTRDRRAFVDEVHKYDKVVTPYGPLVQDLKLALTDGGMHTAKVLNPFALLWSAAKPSVAQIVGKSHWPPPLYHECDWACGPNFALGYSGVGPLRLPTVCRTFGVVGSSPYRPPWPRASSRCISTASRITRCSTATR